MAAGLVSIEVVSLSQPLPKLIIYLSGAGQLEQVDDPVRGSRQRTSDPQIAHLVREIKTQQNRPYARPELGNLAVAFEKDPHVDGILVNRPQTA